jgi:hypothetical protein
MTQLFSRFPSVPYTFEQDKSPKQTVNLTARLNILKFLKENSSYFDTYRVEDGYRPEVIADKLYDNPGYYWVILLINDIADPFFEWPLSQAEIDSQLASIYHGTLAVVYYNSWLPVTPTLQPGMTLYQTSNPSTTYRIYDSDTSTGQIFLTEGIPSKVNHSVNINGTIYTVDIKRTFEYPKFGLHHFEDEDGNALDSHRGIPLLTSAGIYEQSPLVDVTYDMAGKVTGVTYNTQPSLQKIFADSGVLAEFGVNLITIEDFWQARNNKRREIVLIKRAFVEAVVEFVEQQLRESR